MPRDSVKAAPGGFIQIDFRDGRIELIRSRDIASIRPRRAPETGTVIQLSNGFLWLVDVEFPEVVAQLEQAENHQIEGVNRARKTTRY
jgi:hypothetical protein